MPEQNPILDALQTSVIINRKDHPGQTFWTEWRTGIVLVGGTPAQAGDIPILGPNGKLDPSVVPTTGSTVSVNGTPVSNPNFNDTTPAAPLGFSNVKWQFDGSGNVSAYYATSGLTVSFGQITSGTNMAAAMVVGSGASLTVACPGTGVIEATELATSTCTPVVINGSAPTHAGQVLISQPGNASAMWGDPFVQGVFPPGTNADTGFSGGPIQPVLIGGRDTSGILRDVAVTPGGALLVVSEDEADNASHFAWDTGPNPSPVPAGLHPLISIRPQAAATVFFFLTGMDVFMAPAIGEFQVIKNGVLTGASFSNVPGSNAQEDTSATAVSGGTRADSGYTQNGVRTAAYQIKFSVGDTYTLAVQKQAGVIPQYANGALRWTEQTQTP